MNAARRYAEMRTWIIGKIVEGASPSAVARWLATYRTKFSSETTEVPTLSEISAYESATSWDEVRLESQAG